MDITASLRGLLADTVVAKYKVHGFHWNVTGPLFPQLHGLFGDIAGDLDDSVDPIAEYLRALGQPAPARLAEFLALTKVSESTPVDPMDMVSDAITALEVVLGCAVECFEAASEANQQGIANFAAERIAATQKWLWQLRVIVGAPFPPVELAEPEEPADMEDSEDESGIDAVAALAARLELASRA